MKLCTLIKFDPDNEDAPPVVSFSTVEDEHQFGWIDGSLHIEGAVEVVEKEEG